MPGVDPVGGWLKVSKTDNGDDDAGRSRALRPGVRRRDRGLADRARARGAQDQPLFPRAASARAPFTSIRSTTRSGSRRRRSGAARASSRTRRRSRSTPTGVRKRIATPHGARARRPYRARRATSTSARLMPRIAGTLVPIWTYVVATAPLGPRLREAIPYRGAVTDTDLADNHYRVVGGDRLLWSGRSTTWDADPRRYAPRLKADIARALSAARRGRDRACLVGRARQRAASHAADRRAVARPLDGERLRRPRPQHHRDGGRDHRAGHRRRRRHLAAVLALRAGVGRRAARPRAHAGLLLVVHARASASRRARRASARRNSRAPTAARRRCGPRSETEAAIGGGGAGGSAAGGARPGRAAGGSGARRRRAGAGGRRRAAARSDGDPPRDEHVAQPRTRLTTQRPSVGRCATYPFADDGRRSEARAGAPGRTPRRSPRLLQAASAPVASRHEGQPLEQMHVLLVLQQRAVQRRDQLLRDRARAGSPGRCPRPSAA